MDFSNCTSFGGRKADPVDKGTDGVEVVGGTNGSHLVRTQETQSLARLLGRMDVVDRNACQ